MNRHALLIVGLLSVTGCGHRYILVGESDTNDGIAISVMKLCPGEPPARIYYTELTGNDTIFTWDERVEGSDVHVEAWFELKRNPGDKTVYALPPGKRVRLKLDEDDDRVVIEETRIDGDEDWELDDDD